MGCVQSTTASPVAPAAGGGGNGISIVNLERLKELDCFVLDNSIRETTVGQTRGHTLNTKLQILSVIKETGISEFVIGSFGAKENVDDKLPSAWRSRCASLSRCWGFCEAWNELSNTGVPLLEPSGGLEEIALRHQMSNAIIEVDVCTPGLTVDVSECVIWQLQWGQKNLASRPNQKPPRMLVNLRDFADCCVREDAMQHALRLVRKLGALPDHHRPIGLMIEEPTAMITPDQMAEHTRKIRTAMKESGWSSGRLLVHVHAGYGLEEAVTLAALSNGCDGIWCAVCKDGAALGHACSAITLTNLARLGNTFVQENYSLPKIIQAAAQVHTIVTGHTPAPRCEVYGSHAFDRTFSGWFGFHDEQVQVIADLLDIKRHVRVSDFATAEMLKDAMIDRFDQPEIGEWDDSLCKQMELTIEHELLSGTSLDHNTDVGLVMLYEKAGGNPSPSMVKKVIRHSAHYHTGFHFMMLKYKWLEVLKQHNLATFKDDSFYYMDMHVDNEDLPDMPWEVFASSFLLPHAQVLHAKPMEWWVQSPSLENFVTWKHFELRMMYALTTKWSTEATKHGNYELATANGLLRLMQKEESQVEHIMNVSALSAKFVRKLRKKIKSLKTLKKVPGFSNMNDSQISKLVDTMKLLKFKPDEIICQEGDDANTFFVIIEGNCAITSLRHGTRTMATIGEMDFFGESMMTTNVAFRTRTATVTVVPEKDENEDMKKKARHGVQVLALERSQYDVLLSNNEINLADMNKGIERISTQRKQENRQNLIAGKAMNRLQSMRESMKTKDKDDNETKKLTAAEKELKKKDFGFGNL